MLNPDKALEYKSSISLWLAHLNTLNPCKGAIIVGAGTSHSPWIQLLERLNIDNVNLIEADEKSYQQLVEDLSTKKKWKIHNKLVGDKSRSADFYFATFRLESGMIAPEDLKELWPNIKTEGVEKKQVTTLCEILKSIDAEPDWLIIDCFCSSLILDGLNNQLSKFNTIITRTTEIDLKESRNDDSTKQDHARLTNHSYRYLTNERDAHPDIVYSAYMQDVNARTMDLEEVIDNKNNNIQELQSKNKELLLQLEDRAQRNNIKKEELILQLEDQSQLKLKNKELSSQLKQTNKEVAKKNEELAARIEELEHLRNKNETLETKISEQDYRQKLSNQEINKASTQIELIKNLLRDQISL